MLLVVNFFVYMFVLSIFKEKKLRVSETKCDAMETKVIRVFSEECQMNCEMIDTDWCLAEQVSQRRESWMKKQGSSDRIVS